MPELERWEQKAIGRINRFENTDYEYVTNQIYEGGRSLLNRIAQGAMNMGRGVVGILSRPLNTQTIDGKGFTENYGVSSRFGRRVGLGAANMAIDAGANTVNNFLTRKFFYPSGQAVADTAFAGRVTFDKEMTRQMFNDCGYAPDFQATMKRMYDTAAVVEKGLTDITWRKDITPHMIRSAYQQELETAFEAIRRQHQENPAFTSRGMMKHQMQAAARHLGNIFEKFTLDLANQTDYLEAPMTILPKKAEVRSDVEMTDDEKKLMAEVSRHSLYPDAKAMEKQIDQAMKKLPKPTVEAALEQFRSNLEKPVLGKDGREAAYTRGANTAEDFRRLDSSILSLREMKQRYENRNFFSRLLSSAARAERRAIAAMESQLQEKLGVRAEALTVLLDLKNPLEEMADPTHFLGIRKRGPEKEPEPPTVTQTVKNAAKKTGEAISAAAKTTYQTGEHIVTGAVSGVTNAVNTVLNAAANVDGGLIDQKDANIFEDLKEKDYEDDLFDRDFTEKHSEPEPKAPEQPKPQEEPQESYLGNLLTGAGMILGALNPLNLFRGSEPKPEKIALFSDDGNLISARDEGVLMQLNMRDSVVTSLDTKKITDYEVLDAKTMTMNIFDSAMLNTNSRTSPREMTSFDLGRQIKRLKKMDNINPKALNQYRMEYFKKFSNPFGSIFFAILALPLAFIFGKHNGQTIGLIFGLVICVIYWAMMIIGQMFSLRIGIDAFIAMWLPNTIVGVAGGLLYIALRRK